MIRSAGQNRIRLGEALLIASIVSFSVGEAAADQAPEPQGRSGSDQANLPRREAPVFTYRQFTAQLPSLSSSPADMDAPEASSFNLPVEPTFPATAHPAGQEQAGLMGRFGQTVDPVAAREGLSGAPAEPVEPAFAEPGTTATLVDQPAPPASEPEPAAAATNTRLLGSGRASWYKHPGKTASGATYDPDKLTAAHHSLPFGTKVKVVNKRNGRSVVVQITDRTNERTKAKRNYTIDLSRASARKLGIDGIGQVALYTVD